MKGKIIKLDKSNDPRWSKVAVIREGRPTIWVGEKQAARIKIMQPTRA